MLNYSNLTETSGKEIMKKIWTTLFYLMAINTHASANYHNEHFIINYHSGESYDVVLTDNTITWTGLEGNDKNYSETDSINRKPLTDEVEVIQWIENDHTFMTLVLDRTQLKTIASGKNQQNSWLNTGDMQQVF
jgi:MoaF C-terminal domain